MSESVKRKSEELTSEKKETKDIQPQNIDSNQTDARTDIQEKEISDRFQEAISKLPTFFSISRFETLYQLKFKETKNTGINEISFLNLPQRLDYVFTTPAVKLNACYTSGFGEFNNEKQRAKVHNATKNFLDYNFSVVFQVIDKSDEKNFMNFIFQIKKRIVDFIKLNHNICQKTKKVVIFGQPKGKDSLHVLPEWSELDAEQQKKIEIKLFDCVNLPLWQGDSILIKAKKSPWAFMESPLNSLQRERIVPCPDDLKISKKIKRFFHNCAVVDWTVFYSDYLVNQMIENDLVYQPISVDVLGTDSSFKVVPAFKKMDGGLWTRDIPRTSIAALTLTLKVKIVDSLQEEKIYVSFQIEGIHLAKEL
jgi:hypothetical protein